MSEPANVVEARQWLDFANDDLFAAKTLLASVRLTPKLVCYHSQQSAEKALKAILVFVQVDFPFTHDLERLVRLVPPSWHSRAIQG